MKRQSAGRVVGMLTKWADCQSVEKARERGSFASLGLATLRLDQTIPKGSANPPPEAKISPDFIFIGAIFAFVGFVSALGMAWNTMPSPEADH